MNLYPWWKNVLLGLVLLLALIYALPNVYGEDPAIQVYGKTGYSITRAVANRAETILKNNGIAVKAVNLEDQNLFLRVYDLDAQRLAQEILQQQLGENYVTAINLVPATPAWLRLFHAEPAKLGLDLQGGVHFLLDVDVESLLRVRQEGEMRSITNELRQESIFYNGIRLGADNEIIIDFAGNDQARKAESVLNTRFQELELARQENNRLKLTMRPDVLNQTRQAVIEQTMTTLRNRVNELGIVEASVQQQGLNRIQVDMPGLQDPARAKEVLGSTATLEFRLHDNSRDVYAVLRGEPSPGSRVYYMTDGSPILLLNQTVLTGDSITGASTGVGEDGRVVVNVRLGGGGESQFYRVTGENIGRRMGIVYVETQVRTEIIDGEEVNIRERVERVISAPAIQAALGNQFVIQGIGDIREARDLSLLLRSGSLPANLEIVQEKVIGPSLGEDNVIRGTQSLLIGVLVLILFMAAYYRGFGMIANMALLLNLIFIMAIMSLLGATLTFPGIAGIVLTMGMAVDANVLICERIREELRNGMSPWAAINAGYEKAFATIVDANLTTLIVAIILFSVGTGAVKGFAVTLTIGILTSMLTAVAYTRAVVNLIYGRRKHIKQLSVGIKV